MRPPGAPSAARARPPCPSSTCDTCWPKAIGATSLPRWSSRSLGFAARSVPPRVPPVPANRGTGAGAVLAGAGPIDPTSVRPRLALNLVDEGQTNCGGELMAKSSVSEVHTTQDLDFIRELAQQLRVDSIRASTTAGSGHPTSSMSAADLIAVLITRYFHYDWNDPTQPNNDHLIFSKGHASPLLYSIFKAVGVVSD